MSALMSLAVLAAWLSQAPPPAGTAARRDSLIWVSEEAAIDSLNSYWRDLDTRWYEPLTPEMLLFELDPAAIDSLGGIGADALSDPDAGRRWRVSVNPVGRFAFSRVEGVRPGIALGLRRPGRLQPRLEVGAGYGIASERAALDASLTWPLLYADPRAARRRAQAAAAKAAAEAATGTAAGAAPTAADSAGARGPVVARVYKPAPPPWSLLTLELAAERRPRSFAGEAGAFRIHQTMFSGEDRNQYHEARGGRAGLLVRPRPWLDLRGGALFEEHRPLPLATTWLLAGDRNDVIGNMTIEPLTTRAATAGLGARWRRLEVQSELEWHRVKEAPWLARLPGAPGHADLRRLRVTAAATLIDRAGDEFALRGAWQAVDREAPLQWKTWLGGYGTLRGYRVAEIAGDRGAWASLDVRWGFDALRALRIPLLGKLGLQPITFFDWGTTRAAGDGALFPPPDGAPLDLPRPDGWRADAGIGFGKLLGAPGMAGNLRVYLGKPVFNGQSDRPWMITLAFEP